MSLIIGPARVNIPRSHRCWRPEAHQKHVPQAGMNAAATWSPTATVSTPSPTSTTMPAPSWPPMHGNSESTPKTAQDLGVDADVTTAEVLVGMAHPGEGHLDPHLVGVRSIDLDLFGLPGLLEPGTDGGTGLHVVLPRDGAPRRRSSRDQHRAARAPASTRRRAGPTRRSRWPGAGRPGPPRPPGRPRRSRAQQAKAAMAAPRAARATVWGPRSPGEPPRPAGRETGHHVAPLLVADGRVGHQRRDRADQHHPDAQLVELAGPEAVGGHHRPSQDVQQRISGRSLGQPVAQPDELGVELPPHDVGLGLVVAEERPARDPDGGGDVVHGRLVVSPAGEELQRGPGHVLARSGRRAPTRRPRPPSRIRPVRSSRFHFGIRCTKLHPPTRPGPAPADQRRIHDRHRDRGDRPPPPRRPRSPSPAAEALVESDLLVEDVSIDGMCGVY